jgi:uncharacterized membrane protein YfcA
MNGFSILFIIFGLLVFLTGLYMFTGHKLEIMTMRAAYRNLNKSDWKNIGKWTMVASIFIFAIAIIGFIFNI